VSTGTATAAGVRIVYEEAGIGPPLLLIHGLGYPRWGWEPIVKRLAKAYRVITFDNRGSCCSLKSHCAENFVRVL
jgi:non-heme chloroperoxidase